MFKIEIVDRTKCVYCCREDKAVWCPQCKRNLCADCNKGLCSTGLCASRPDGKPVR